VLSELDRHPHARAVLSAALEVGGKPSHAYLFHGPDGAGKRAAARAVACELLARGVQDEQSARRRALSGAHPDLTWVSPSGAHEILVSDIAEPVVAAAAKTPFEATRRVFVIERVDELGEEAANRMLKTLEEPPDYVHLILLTSRLAEVLPTIRSRCQLVRFDAPPVEKLVEELGSLGLDREAANACARLSLGDGNRARELAGADGVALRGAAERFARTVVTGDVSEHTPWLAVMEAVRERGDLARSELEGRAAAELELYSRKDQRRLQTEWSERIRRVRRRVETAALDLSLQLVELWFWDLACLQWHADELVRNCDRRSELAADAGPEPSRLRRAIELVEDTRQRFALNVTEELACEALAYRLARTLAV
jgi:DNA polymerase-3 subunit delta'